MTPTQNDMEGMAVHASTPPPEPLAPSLVPTPIASPRAATRALSAGAEKGDDGDKHNEKDLKADQNHTKPPADVPRASTPPNPSPPSHTARSPRPSPMAELAPLPDFDVEAPPAVAPVEIDKELEIQHKDDEEDPREAADAPENAENFDGQEAPPGAAGMPELSGWIGDIQDIPEQDYDAYDLQAEAEPEPTPHSPREFSPGSPLTDLPTELEDIEPIPVRKDVVESSGGAQNGGSASGPSSADERVKTPDTLVEVDESENPPKRKGRKLSGPESKRAKKSVKPRQMVDEDLGVVRDVPKPRERTQPRAKSVTDQRLRTTINGQTTELQCQPCLRDRYMPWGKCVQCIAKVGGDACRFRNYRLFPLDPVTSEIIGKGTFPSTELDGELTPLPRTFNTVLTEEHIERTERTVAPMLLSLITAELRHVVKNSTITRPVDTAQHRAVCDFCSSTIFGGFFFCDRCGRDYCLLCERYVSNTNDNLLDSPWPISSAARSRLQRCSRAPDSALPLPKTNLRTGTVKYTHSREDFVAVSRFTEKELRTNWTALANFVLQPGGDVDVQERLDSLRLREDEVELQDAVREWFESHKGKRKHASHRALSKDEVQALYAASADLPHVDDPAGLGSQPFMFIEGNRLDNDTFDQIWARGEPLVVNNVTGDMRIEWTPEMFIERFGPEECFVLDCKTEKVSSMTIGQFFSLLGDPTRMKKYTPPYVPPPPAKTPPPPPHVATGTRKSSRARKQVTYSTPEVQDEPQTVPAEGGSQRAGTPSSARNAGASAESGEKPNGDVNGDADGGKPEEDEPEEPKPITTDVLKLKDWPMTNDFSVAYPDLYADFSRALPVPDFTARNGVLNMYSHFPAGATRPDIGPKMYNAFAGVETEGGQGSTRMHMDMADAVNIMLYAAEREDGTPGCAVWDVFRAEDAEKIRDFLTKKFASKAKFFTDPIHSQMFYLDSKLRKQLFEDKGVKSFRVYQYPGQAVFIPAGCAHQVCNLADCIKIALDFVSPHNVRRCQQLAQDFRRENFVKAWKDDVLQLYNVLWYAWVNVRETRERRAEEAAKAEAERARRETHLMSLHRGGIDSYAPSHRYHTTLTSSVRDDPTPSPLGTERGTPAPLSAQEKDEEKDGSPKKSNTEAEANGDSPPAALVQKLMDAALVREHRPIHLAAEDAKRHSPTPAPATPEPETEPAPPPDEKPVRLSEQIAAGHIPSDLVLQVMQSQMGGEPIEID